MELILLYIISLATAFAMEFINTKINYVHDKKSEIYAVALLMPLFCLHFDTLFLQITYLLLFLTLAEIAYIDLKYMEIPHTYTILTVVLGAGFAFYMQEPKLLIVAVINFLLFLIVSVVSKALGGGDVKLAFGLGLFFDFLLLKNFYIYTFGVAFIWAVWMLLFKKQSKEIKIPFAPFMAIGAYLAIML